MDLAALPELPAFLAVVWTELQRLQKTDAPLFAFVVIGLVFLEGVVLSVLLDLVLRRFGWRPGAGGTPWKR
jgi:hypothetical protein